VAHYSFLTTWIVEAPRDEVWEAIHALERWPEWWPGVRRVEKLEPGNGEGIGALYAHEWRSVIPYPVRFRTRITRIERPYVIEADADGELAGTGRWRFADGGETTVTYEWNVRTTPLWMNLVAPVARPLFRWNHNVVMHRGGEGLARLLGTRLVAVT
jgi:carbon monoxide dehydrogenase subunit G